MSATGEQGSRRISAEAWRQIVDSAIDTAIITTDERGQITSWNEGARRILGWTAEEMFGQTLDRLFPNGTGADAIRREMEDALRSGRGGGEEGWRVRKDGQHFWASGEITPIRNGATTIGFTKVLRDRSAQRAAEETAREERRALELLNRAGSTLAAEIDLHKLVQIVTDAGVELTGAEFGAFFYNVLNQAGESYMLYTLSGAPLEAFSKFQMPRNTAVFGPTFSGEGIVRSDDITKDPRYGHNPPYHGQPKGHLPVRSYLAVPVISRSGEVIGGLFFGHGNVGVFTDQSERGLAGLAAEAAVAIDNARLFEQLERELEQRRVAELELAASEDRLRLATQAADIGTWDFDPRSGELRCDDRCKALNGLPPDAQVTYRDLFLGIPHRDDRKPVRAAVEGALDPKGSGNFDVEYRVTAAKDGVERWIGAKGRAVFEDSRAIRFIGTMIDLTHRKAAESELRGLNEKLEERVGKEIARRSQAEEALRQAQKMEAVGQLTGGIAHDFNNLLTVVTGNIGIAERALDAAKVTDARTRRALTGAMKGAERAAALTQRLLAFARRQPLAPKPIDVNKLVVSMSELLQRSLGELVRLEIVTASGLWMVEADINQLESAIINLAVNARDAMPRGGQLTIETANCQLDERYAAENAEVPPGQYVMIAVTDTGAGMAMEVLTRAFEPFFTTKEVGKGTGLGLSMIYGFVKQSGGHVKIYSEDGEGTTVKIYLPRLLRNAAADEESEASAGRFETIPRQETILVVEDDDDVRAYTVDCLRELGYRVLEAHDGPSALRLLERQEEPVDLLFTDVVMPGMTGRELADEAHRTQPRLRVLYTSGYTHNAIVHGGRLDQGVEVIAKPFTFEALAQKVQDMLNSGRTRCALIVNSDPAARSISAVALDALELRSEVAGSGAEAMNKVRFSQGRYDIVILDDSLSDYSAESLASEIRALYLHLPMIIISQKNTSKLERRFGKDPCIVVNNGPASKAEIEHALQALDISCPTGSAREP